MAVDMFLKIEGIDGESNNKDHVGWIEVLSWSWGESLPAARIVVGAGAPPAGKVSMSSFTFMKRLDKATPQLLQACMMGKVFPKVEFHVVRSFAGVDGQTTEMVVDFLKLTNSLVSSVRMSDAQGAIQAPGEGNPNSLPLELCSLNFTKISWTYQQTDTLGGAVGSPLKAGWDLKLNKKI